jgi:hypothetical protein
LLAAGHLGDLLVRDTMHNSSMAARSAPGAAATGTSVGWPSSSFGERHRVISLATTVLALMLTGILVGSGVGALGVHLVDIVVAHADPAG